MKTNKEFIEGIYQKYEEEKLQGKDRFKKIEIKPKKHKLAPIKILGTIATFAVIFSVIFIYQIHEEDINIGQKIYDYINNQYDERIKTIRYSMYKNKFKLTSDTFANIIVV